MVQMIVHSIPGSPYGRAVLATLEEKGAAYRLSPDRSLWLTCSLRRISISWLRLRSGCH